MPGTGAQRPQRVVVVDDDPQVRGLLAEYLGRHGFEVRAAGGGAELDVLLGQGPADLLVLDVTMPGEDGISIARRIRAQCATPILMLTAVDATVDRVVGLEIGADDYVTKPFDSREQLARIRAILRRTAVAEPASAPRPAGEVRGGVRFGKVTLDLETRCLVAGDGATQELTAMEYDLLQAFASNANRVLTRDRLLDLAHNRNMEPFDRSIDVRIARIRRKIEDDPAKPQVIRTVRGVGYMFVPARD